MNTMLERRGSRPRLMEWLDMPEWFGSSELGRFFDRDRFGDTMRIEETQEDHRLVIKAEMPGIDPDRDVDITMADGMLTIKAERREEYAEDEDGRHFSEFRYGSFRRSIPVPPEARLTDVVATYQDGILRIEVPMAEVTEPKVTKVPVTRK